MIYNRLKKRHFPTWEAIFVFFCGFVVLISRTRAISSHTMHVVERGDQELSFDPKKSKFTHQNKKLKLFEKCESPIFGDFATNIP